MREGDSSFMGMVLQCVEKVLVGGDACTTLWMRLMLLNCAPEKC